MGREQGQPDEAAVDTARKLYGTRNEELMDNAKQFAYYPVAVLKTVDNFSNGTISMKFKTVAGDLDRCSGILFNVKPNGDWLTIRYNDTENNVVLWEFHNGIRRSVRRGPEGKWMLDRAAWHELKMTVNGTDFKAYMDGELALEFTLGSTPGPGRNGNPPNPDLVPRQQPGAAAADLRASRAMVQDRQHERVQGLRGNARQVIPAVRRVRSTRRTC